MRCLCCDAELIHGGDHDVDDNDDYIIESNLHCPACTAMVFVLWPRNPPPPRDPEVTSDGG